jgi:hypothetical protein
MKSAERRSGQCCDGKKVSGITHDARMSIGVVARPLAAIFAGSMPAYH